VLFEVLADSKILNLKNLLPYCHFETPKNKKALCLKGL
jgi:hypothetical protein